MASARRQREREAAARRQRRKRKRDRQGLRVWNLVISDRAMEDVLDALVQYGRLTERDCERQDRVERVLAEALVEIGKRWRADGRQNFSAGARRLNLVNQLNKVVTP
jgi:hypothetical protein